MRLQTFKTFIITMLFASVVLCGGFDLSAQSTIRGKVVEPSGEPIIGATIAVKGSSRGTATDVDGAFVLNEKPGTAITISYIGYKTVETTLKNGMRVVMEENQTSLAEVVVVGYGTQKKETLTGAIAVVDDKMLKDKGAMSSPLQALQGQVPGVIITRSSGAPGDESWSMSMRGSVSKNSVEPLIIIDGVAYESVNSLRLLNSDDIKSISFLKDAAAAIYGARAAGGVVLVTTKEGSKGKTTVQYSGSVTMKHPGCLPELMSIDEWADAVLQSVANDGAAGNETWRKYATLAKAYKGQYIDLTNTANPFGTTAFTDVYDFCFMDQDWLSLLFGDATSTQHNLSISGGGDVATYRLSLGYLYDGSTLKHGNNNNQRYNMRLNNTFKLSNRLTLESSISYNRQAQVAPVDVGAILTSNYPMPGLPVETINGLPYAWGTWESPAARADYEGDNKLKVSALNISEMLKADLGRGFSANVSLGFNTSNATRTKQRNQITYYNYAGTLVSRVSPDAAQTYYSETSSRKNFYSVSGQLNWQRSFNKVHDLKVMAGGQYEKEDYSYFGAQVKDINSSLDGLLGSGEIKLVHSPGSNMKYEYGLASMFGRFNYDYNSKYLVEANFRYDGSSKFMKGNRWKAFYGFSLGWRLSQESFMKGIDWLNELKIRASYGNVGNQSGIGYYDGTQLYNTYSNSGALIGTGLLSYMATSGTLASATRQWERIHNYNVGVDFGLLNNRLTGTVEYFQKRNNNMLINISYPGILGDNAPASNTGKFKAWGAEGSLNWRDKIGETGFTYNVGGTFTFARNKLVEIGGTSILKSGYVAFQQGYPIGSVFGLRYGGKILNEEMLKAYEAKFYDNGKNGIGMPSNLRLGDNMFCDVSGDGRLDENDYVYLGTDVPEISYSFNVGAQYKGIEFSMVFQGVGNRTVFRDTNNNWRCPMRSYFQNSTNQSVGNVWSVDNPNGKYPTYTQANGPINSYNYQCSSWSAEDGSYIRLKNVTLGYNLPASLLAKTKAITACKVYVEASDLWEHSKISDGWDPEASRSVSGVGRYPFTRNVTFGLNVSF